MGKNIRLLEMAISSKDRVLMIDTIKETAADEFETLHSLWELSKKTNKELKKLLKDILDYYKEQIWFKQ